MINIDKQLIKDYRLFCDNVIRCNTLLIAAQPSDHDKIIDLIALTAGQAMGLASRIGLRGHIEPPPKSIKPWVEIGISRTTYYRDQKRSRDNEQT